MPHPIELDRLVRPEALDTSALWLLRIAETVCHMSDAQERADAEWLEKAIGQSLDREPPPLPEDAMRQLVWTLTLECAMALQVAGLPGLDLIAQEINRHREAVIV